MRYLIKPIVYTVWKTIVVLSNYITAFFVVLWYFDVSLFKLHLDSRVPLVFTEGKTMKYRSYSLVYVIIGYESLTDYIHNRISYYYLDGSHFRLGKVGDLHWKHCNFEEPRS